MTYIDPMQSDAEFINNDSRLSRRQADMDYAEIKAKGGFDAALLVGTKFRVPQGYKRIPGASRSGALDPSTRSRFLNREKKGEIELARDEYGKLLGYRETNNYESEEDN
jgi:hypothetical protein